jgi:hypothetical protein
MENQDPLRKINEQAGTLATFDLQEKIKSGEPVITLEKEILAFHDEILGLTGDNFEKEKLGQDILLLVDEIKTEFMNAIDFVSKTEKTGNLKSQNSWITTGIKMSGAKLKSKVINLLRRGVELQEDKRA